VSEPSQAEQLLPARAPALRRAVGGAVLLAVVLLAAHALSLDDRARVYLDAARGAGLAGVLLHAVAYVGAALLGLPLSPITAAVGAAYGPIAGAALAVPAATIGACSAFVVGRVVARDPETIARGPEVFVGDVPGNGNRYLRSARGIEAVIVNGALTLERGHYTDERAGRIV